MMLMEAVALNLLVLLCERKYISVEKEEKCISHHRGEPGNDDNRDHAPCCMKSCKCDRLAVLSWVTHVLECVIAFMVLKHLITCMFYCMSAIPREFSECLKRIKSLLVLSQFECKGGKTVSRMMSLL